MHPYIEQTFEHIGSSINPNGQRITTIRFNIPKTMLAQFNKHRIISSNTSSSRAIPTLTLIKDITKNPYIPHRWPANGPGMSPNSYLQGDDAEHATKLWLKHLQQAITTALQLSYGITDPQQAEEAAQAILNNENTDHITPNPDAPKVHKEVINRILEPWAWATVVATATEWDSLIAQRGHGKGAQSEINNLATLVKDLLQTTTPAPLNWGETHAPLSPTNNPVEAVEAAARASYRKTTSTRPAGQLYEQLLQAPHPSPFEHVATAKPGVHRNFHGWEQHRARLEQQGWIPLYTDPAFINQ